MSLSTQWDRALEVWQTTAEAIGRLQEIVDRGAFNHCVKLISECKGRILTTGVGTSAAAARKIAHTLSCIERPSFFLASGDAVHGALGCAQPSDICILISKGGTTREIVDLVPALKSKKILIIGVTENKRSILAKNSDLLLKVQVEREADPFDMLATISTLAVIAVFDAISIAVMEITGYTKEQFAVIHPGGSVGERLLRDTKKETR